MRSDRHVRLGWAAALACLGVLPPPAAVHARPRPFSFGSVEFMPAEGRLPAARAYIAQTVRAGMPLPEAIAAVQGAGVRCDAPPTPIVRCTRASLQRPPDGQVQDVVWTVRLIADPEGQVTHATVTRAVYGL